MAIGESLGGIIGGFLGSNAAKMDREKQKKYMKEALQYYKSIGLPPDYSKALVLEEFQRQGVYTPELEQEIEVAESEVGKIQEDQAIKDAQRSALADMQQRAKVGLSAEDRAALNQVRSEVQRDAEAKRQQILQQMQSRGMGGSGAELAMQLQAAQGAADQAASASDSVMAQAQQRALQALGQSADLASQVRSQDFGVAQTKASALDERNKFLAQNAIDRQRQNVQMLNAAQLANLQEQQRIADANTAMQNAEKQRQVEAQRAQYQDKLNYAAGASGQARNLAGYYGDTADAKAAQQVAIGKGIGGIADSGYNMVMGTGSGQGGQQGGGGLMSSAGGMAGLMSMFSDEKLKENIDYNDKSVEEFLDKLKPASYNYKDEVKDHPMASDKKQVGVMAQDLEKSDLGKSSVHDTEEGKVVDYQEMQPKIVASLANLHNRLKKFGL